MLATVPAGKKVLIEVKCGPEIVPELDRVLRATSLNGPSSLHVECQRCSGWWEGLGEKGPREE